MAETKSNNLWAYQPSVAAIAVLDLAGVDDALQIIYTGYAYLV